MPITPVTTVLVAPAEQTTPIIMTFTNNVVTLVQIVQSMRELGCEPYLKELDVEIAGRQLRTIENIMDQIQVSKDL